ncbi:hypothetical protein [Demequina sp.]|uniref:hypothetical protein n=1 Tax=Demequina sp. TaxID=2050685 RepID=UPI0025D84AA6|nr:hypothetical protein [Demequina sp.]
MRRAIGRWAIFAIAIPLTAAALGLIADQVEQHRGADSKVVKGLRVGRSILRPGS